MITVLELPKLRNDQAAIVKHPAKRKTLAMGRRWGKTVLGHVVVANVVRQHGKAAWVVPTYKNGRPLWRAISQSFSVLAKNKVCDISKSERTITTSRGGFFGIFSADNIDAMRGEAFHLVVNDEAARISEEARFDVIEPVVADYDGDIIDISTPKGRNWFWREFQKGQMNQSPLQASFTAPSSANPSPHIRKAFEMARERVSSRAFRQEWLAEFLEDGTFFVNVTECATASIQDSAVPGHSYVIGVDWARSSSGDYTVFVVVDATIGAMAHMQRFHGVDYNTQRARLKLLWQRFNRGAIVAEYNAMGGPLVEALQADNLPVRGFTTTATTKHEIISGLHMALENNQLAILNDPILVAELQAFEVHERSGIPSYSAPSGMHDDTVMSLAMAWSALNNKGLGIMDYYRQRAAKEKENANSST